MGKLIEYGLSERFSAEAKLYQEFKTARVIAQYKGMYKIITDDGEFLAEISGKLKYNTNKLENIRLLVILSWFHMEKTMTGQLFITY